MTHAWQVGEVQKKDLQDGGANMYEPVSVYGNVTSFNCDVQMSLNATAMRFEVRVIFGRFDGDSMDWLRDACPVDSRCVCRASVWCRVLLLSAQIYCAKAGHYT